MSIWGKSLEDILYVFKAAINDLDKFANKHNQAATVKLDKIDTLNQQVSEHVSLAGEAKKIKAKIEALL